MIPLLFLFLSLAASSFPQVSAVKSIGLGGLIGEEDLLHKGSLVDKINGNPNVRWKAALNPHFADYTTSKFKYILGVKLTAASRILESAPAPVVTHEEDIVLPKQFDARTNWPQCSTIQTILDQGHCGSCWAFGPVEALSDRFCVHFGVNVSLSVNDLLSCCGSSCGVGCSGGDPMSAWNYFIRSGIVTEECDPYFDAIGCNHPGCVPRYRTPKCEKKCKVKKQQWEGSKHFAVSAYRISNNSYDIMAELYKNGPLEASYSVYQDLAYYKSGVYKHVTGRFVGGHAVKIIGWGTTDDGEDYWLVANLWNTSWGDDGFFKISRGTNECDIEANVIAGMLSSRNLIKSFPSAQN